MDRQIFVPLVAHPETIRRLTVELDIDTNRTRLLLEGWVHGWLASSPARFDDVRCYLQIVTEVPPHLIVSYCSVDWAQAKALQVACLQLLDAEDPDPVVSSGSGDDHLVWSERQVTSSLRELGVAA